MVSIKDVAKHAGVAISTVSKVLNNYPNIRLETRTKVNQAVKELNYVPNSVAAALSSKQPCRIALLINIKYKTQAIDEIYMQYISGGISRATELNLDIITVFFSMIENKSIDELDAYFMSQSITGIVIYGISKEDNTLHQLINRERFKVVVIDAPIFNTNTSSVWIDNHKAQYEVAKKTILENIGHASDRVLYLSGKKNGYVSEARLTGMEKLAADLNLEMLVRCGEFSELKARNLTMRFAKNKDIIVCASDLMAIGAMRTLTEMNIFRPVCGFDGISLMGYAGKQMNTVKQDFARISAEAVTEAARLLNGGEGRNIVLDFQIVRLKYEDIIC
ncbi:MAG: LacI family transcriptional regulator [Lachnospiraceae bacterium]|nr:LacI family transcriptional regulator [Lachnospiraceae bacterium]